MVKYDKNVKIPKSDNIAISKWTETRNIRKHTHDFFEIVYTISGSATHYIDDIKYNVVHGDLIFINKNQTHSYSVNKGTEMVNILLNPEFISNELVDEESILFLFKYSLVSEFQNIDVVFNQSVSFKEDDLIEVDNLISMLVREYKSKDVGYQSILNNGIKLLFSKILRYINADTPKKLQNEETMEFILNYINENLSKKISLSELAAKSFYTPAYFGSLLKKYCDKSFNEYLREKRMEKAAEYLANTSEPIDDIMYTVGYNGRPLFYRHFKEIYGVTPGQFRNNIKCNAEGKI